MKQDGRRQKADDRRQRTDGKRHLTGFSPSWPPALRGTIPRLGEYDVSNYFGSL